MRLTDIEQDCYRRLGINTSTTPTTDKDRIRAFINETQREVLRVKHFSIFRRRLVTTASIANIPFMAIPRAATRVSSVMDRTNDYYLEEKPLNWIRTYDPSLRAITANPWAYAVYDLASPVYRQPLPATPVQLFVKSSSAADVTQKVYIEGVRSDGSYQSENKVLVGVTAQGLTATDTVAINKFYIDGTTAGDVSLLDAAAGNVLGLIRASYLASRYTLLHLYPVPSAVNTYYCDIDVHVEDMSQLNDEPLLPEEFHAILAIGARKKEYEKRGDWTGVKLLDEEFRAERSRMITWVHQQAGLTNPQSGRRRFSQLGTWFPDGS